MAKSMKNYVVAFLVAALLFIPFLFVGCSDNSDYKKQIEELQEQLDNSIYVVNLTKETASNVQVKANFEFLIQIKDSSSFTYFDSTNSITLQVYNISDGSWIEYGAEQTTNAEFTFGSDIYKIKVVSIENATSAVLSILQTATQRE